MIATSDFSGLVSSACALASAAAMVPMDSLERCMAALHAQDIKAHRTGFGSLGSNTMPDRFLGVLGHKGLELCLGILMLEVSLARAPKHAGEFRPGIGCAHVDDPHRFDPRAGRLEPKQSRWLAILNAAPEFFLGREQEMLVEGIGRDGDLQPSAAIGNNREHCRLSVYDPHVVLELRHVFFGRDLLRKRPGQHELRLEDSAALLNRAVEGCRHPADDRMLDPPLHLRNDVPGIALEPIPVEGLGHEAKLDDEVVGEVLRLGLTAFLAPQPQQGSLIAPNVDPGVGAADKAPPDPIYADVDS